MIIKMFTVGRFLTNCYIVACQQTKEAIIIDPGFNHHLEAEKPLKFIHDNTLTSKFILNTHGHPDHTCGNKMMKKRFHTPILIHEHDAHMLGKSSIKTDMFGFENSSPPADILLHDGDSVQFGKITLKVIHTPGHTRGSISLLAKKEIFTGDTLFAGSIGRTDFPESSELDMKSSLKKLAKMPNQLIIYPGHGPTTTISQEKHGNPFLQSL